jgi:Ser/Thr protein kinase RdoA (MazF antagonist)
MFSVFDPGSIDGELMPHYKMGITRTIFYNQGMNDIYQVQAKSVLYYLRVSPVGLRTYEDIEAEIDLLMHLKKCGMPVAAPLQDCDGRYIQILDAPEGRRYAVLFEDAGGVIKGIKTEQEAVSLGALLARIHSCTEDVKFHPKKLDVEYFIDAPMGAISNYYGTTASGKELEKIAGTLRKKFQSLSDTTDQSFGIIHGDTHNYNIRYRENGPILFDFDSFGFGPRMYDLGEQLWNIKMFNLNKDAEQLQLSWLLHGYESVRPLSEKERDSIVFYAAVRDLWLMGAQLMSISRNRGASFADQEYADTHLAFLKSFV